MRASIAFKIFLGFTFVILSFGVVSVYSIYKMGHVRARLVLISDTYVPLTQVLTQAISIQNQEEERFKEVEKNPQFLQYGISRMPKKLPDYLERAKKILDAAHSPASRFDASVLNFAQKRLTELRQEAAEYMLKRIELEKRVEAGQTISAELMKDVRSRQSRIGAKLSELFKYTQARVKHAADRTQELGTQSTFAVSILSLLALAIGVGTGALAHFTLRPLSRLAEAARIVGRGGEPETIATTAKDEIGALAREFDKMVRSLKARDQKIREKHQELEALTRFHSDIIRSISTGIVVVGKDGLVRGINPAGLALWELEPAIEGQPLAHLPLIARFPEDAQKLILAEVSRAMSAGERPEPFRALPYGLPGKEKLVDLRIVPFADAAGDIEGVLLLGEDATEEVRTKERLIQSERLATVGRMAAQVAHEIRNPLSSIGLNAELLEEDLAHSDEGRRLLQSIQAEVDRLAAITEDYLQYARLPRPQRAPCDVNALCQALCEFSRPEAEARKVTLSLSLGDLPSIRADESQLRQALLNLLRNAFEALADSGGEVRICTGRTDEAVEITVSDNGPGIPPKILARIFEPFFSTKSGGTGLGLALTQQIIEGHGGQIRIDTSPEKGSTFLIQLPIA